MQKIFKTLSCQQTFSWHQVLKVFTITFLIVFSSTTFAETPFVKRSNVQQFISYMVKKHDFKRAQLVALFSKVHIRPRILQSVKTPLEAKPWYEYKIVFVNPTHIRKGVEFWNRYANTLSMAEKKYGVPASIIVATIGVETMYGKNKGEYPVIEALTNIGFSDSKRAKYFRTELEEFLLLTREQNLNPLTVRGSYAGAIGQPQFMPSSYRYYAVSFYGKKHIDLNKSEEDIIASIANYYKKHGWKSNEQVAIQIQKQPATTKPNIIQLQTTHGNEYWVALNNFQVIKRYNSNNLYAMAVYQLSNYITILKEKLKHA